MSYSIDSLSGESLSVGCYGEVYYSEVDAQNTCGLEFCCIGTLHTQTEIEGALFVNEVRLSFNNRKIEDDAGAIHKVDRHSSVRRQYADGVCSLKGKDTFVIDD
ncbi:MAG TPA: hypothetical protein VMU21_12220 [Thermodesulfovibrionales bacterium]|nr:hypothetical protein [Thermodesulfovibrionales bacterium]